MFYPICRMPLSGYITLLTSPNNQITYAFRWTTIIHISWSTCHNYPLQVGKFTLSLYFVTSIIFVWKHWKTLSYVCAVASYVSALLKEGEEPTLDKAISSGWPASLHLIGKVSGPSVALALCYNVYRSLIFSFINFLCFLKHGGSREALATSSALQLFVIIFS